MEGPRQDADGDGNIQIGGDGVVVKNSQGSIVAGRDLIVSNLFPDEEWYEEANWDWYAITPSYLKALDKHPEHDEESIVEQWRVFRSMVKIVSSLMPRGLHDCPTKLLEQYFAICVTVENVGREDVWMEDRLHKSIMKMKTRVRIRKLTYDIFREGRDLIFLILLPFAFALWLLFEIFPEPMVLAWDAIQDLGI